MDDLCLSLEELKLSALSKSKKLNKFVKNVTIGPNINDELDKPNVICTLSDDNVKYDNKEKIDEMLINKKCLILNEKIRQQNVMRKVEDRIKIFKEQENRMKIEKEDAMKSNKKKLFERLIHQENKLRNELHTIELEAKEENCRIEEFRKLQEQKRSENVQKIQDKYLEMVTELLNKQKGFRSVYKEILEDCEQYNIVLEKYEDKLKDLDNKMNKVEINLNCKNSELDLKSLEMSTELLSKIKELHKFIKMDLKEFKKQTEEKTTTIQQEKIVENNVDDASKREQESKKVTETVENKSKHPVIFQFVSDKSIEIYKELDIFLKNYEDSFKTLLNDDKYKRYRFDCQKAVNMPINAITAVNGTHLMDKYNRLAKFLSGQTVEIGNTQVSINQHPQALAYCTDLLAKKFVFQGDLTVSSNPKSAFAFAAVIVALWTRNPVFGKLVLAHFFRECIYLVPMYLPQAEGQSDSNYYKSLGYRYADNEIESQDKFLKRMSGLIRLYSAILITKQCRINTTMSHPHGIKNGWKWISNILNLEPRIDITATVLYNFLDVAGNEMLSAYGKQFRKIMTFVYKDFLPKMEKIDTGGPVVRLQVFLNDVLKKGNIPPPDGALPSNFW